MAKTTMLWLQAACCWTLVAPACADSETSAWAGGGSTGSEGGASEPRAGKGPNQAGAGVAGESESGGRGGLDAAGGTDGGGVHPEETAGAGTDAGGGTQGGSWTQFEGGAAWTVGATPGDTGAFSDWCLRESVCRRDPNAGGAAGSGFWPGGAGSDTPNAAINNAANLPLSYLTDLRRAFGRALNTRGDVVGEMCGAFLLRDGEFISIGGFAADQGSYAVDVNELGVVLAASILGTSTHPFLWKSGRLRALEGVPEGVPVALNDREQVLFVLGSRGYLWDAGRVTNLGSLHGARVTPLGLNNLGHVVGRLDWRDAAQDQLSAAFIWKDGVMRELPDLGGDASSAQGLNDRGQIVGSSTTAEGGNSSIAAVVLWDGDLLLNLSAMAPDLNLDTRALHINQRGDIAGNAFNHGFVYSAGTFTTFMGSVGGKSLDSVLHIEDINDRGDVLGVGRFTYWGGVDHVQVDDHGMIWSDRCFTSCCP